MALAWVIRALVQHVPAAEKARPEPPKPPRKPSRRLSAEERVRTKGVPSWNGQPKRDWDGPDVPNRPERPKRSEGPGRPAPPPPG